MISYHTR